MQINSFNWNLCDVRYWNESLFDVFFNFFEIYDIKQNTIELLNKANIKLVELN